MSITVRLLWNRKHFFKIQSNETEIEEACKNKIFDMCKAYRTDPKNLVFDKLPFESKVSDIEEFVIEDVLNIIPKIVSPRKRKQDVESEQNKENLERIFSLSKSITNEILTSAEKQHSYNFFAAPDVNNNAVLNFTSGDMHQRKIESVENLPSNVVTKRKLFDFMLEFKSKKVMMDDKSESEIKKLNANDKSESEIKKLNVNDKIEPEIKKSKIDDKNKSDLKMAKIGNKNEEKAVIVEKKVIPSENKVELENSLKDLYYDTGDETAEFQSLLQKLFYERRAFIVSKKPPTVRQVKARYPYLFILKQIISEFEFIAEKNNMFETFIRNIEKLSCFIIKLTITSSPFKEQILRALRNAEDQTEKKRIQNAASLLLLPNYLNEARNAILLFQNEFQLRSLKSCPYIRSSGDALSCLQKDSEFKIVVEGVTICQVKNIFEAFFGLMSAYYIFNAVYPDLCWKTFNLLERLYSEYTPDPETFMPEDENKVKFLEKYCSYRETLNIENEHQLLMNST